MNLQERGQSAPGLQKAHEEQRHDLALQMVQAGAPQDSALGKAASKRDPVKGLTLQPPIKHRDPLSALAPPSASQHRLPRRARPLL